MKHEIKKHHEGKKHHETKHESKAGKLKIHGGFKSMEHEKHSAARKK